MDSRVKISIIMPVYNSRQYLEKCIDSILNQDFAEFELLLIDDGSTDGSEKICDMYAEKDSRVRVFHKSNSGISSARNFGLAQAQGEYIAFSDHDDCVEEGFLKDNYTVAVDQCADIVKFGRKSQIIQNGVVKSTDYRSFRNSVLDKREIKSDFLKLRFDGAMTCVWDGLFKRKFLNDNGLVFDIGYKKGGEDIDFCSKCFSKANIVVLRNKVYYNHYIRIGYSTSTRTDKERLVKFRKLFANLNFCVDELGISIREQTSYYSLNVMKELIYPSMVYFINTGTPFENAIVYLKSLSNDIEMMASSYKDLLQISPKWGLFTILFQKEQYRLLYTLLYCYHRGRV